jgi:uncharacterized membrane protein
LPQFASPVEDSPELLESATYTKIERLRSSPRHSKLRAILLALVVVCFNAVGNLSLAWGMKQVANVGVNPSGYVLAMVNPFVANGILLLIFWLLTRMALMSWADLSFVQPLMAIGYVVAAVLGKVVLHEQVGLPQWLGILLIVIGSASVGSTHHRSNV